MYAPEVAVSVLSHVLSIICRPTANAIPPHKACTTSYFIRTTITAQINDNRLPISDTLNNLWKPIFILKCQDHHLNLCIAKSNDDGVCFASVICCVCARERAGGNIQLKLYFSFIDS